LRLPVKWRFHEQPIHLFDPQQGVECVAFAGGKMLEAFFVRFSNLGYREDASELILACSPLKW
jgi:hypothetical protein